MKRKLSFVLATLLASIVGNVYAQFSADKTYIISNRNDASLFMQDNGTGLIALGGLTSTGYWKLIATENADCYYVQNASTSKYMQSTAGTEVVVQMGDTPVEICIKDCSAGEGEGMYGMASTDQETFNFTSGTVGCNWKNDNTVQGFAAVSGSNHRSFWKIVEAEMPQPVVLSSPYTGSTVADGDFFIYNVQTGLWLQNNDKNTGDWNTRGASGDYGFDFAISAIDGGWKLNPKFGNNHSMNISNFYLDTNDGVSAWTLEPIEVEGVTNAYTIKGGDQVLGLDGNDNIAWTSDKSVWQLVTREERIAYMKDNASETNPIDATFLIQDPRFANANERASAWVWNQDGGNKDDNRWFHNRRSYAIWNSNNFSITQTINNIPNGYYKLNVKGYYRDGDKDQVAERRAAGTENLLGKYFINNDKASLMSILDGATENWIDGIFYYPAADATAPYGHYPDNADGFNRAFQDYPNNYMNAGIVSMVTTKSMKIGLEKMGANAKDWMAWDEFYLSYLGPIDVTEYITALSNAISTAEGIDVSNTTDTLKTALANAIATAKEKLTSEDPDEISEATVNLNTAVENVKAVNLSILRQTMAVAEEGIDLTEANDFIANGTSADAMNKVLNNIRTARKMNAMRMPDIYTGSAPAEGKVYLFNVGTGTFLGMGSDWSTHAAVDQVGIEVELKADGESFTLHTPYGSFNNSPYVDTGANTKYNFTAVEGQEKVYNIIEAESGDLMGWNPEGKTDGKKYWNSISNVAGAAATDANYQWKLITADERAQLIDSVSAEKPVDVSYLINNPSLNRKSGYDMWTKQCDGGNGGARVSTINDNNGDRAADYAWEYFEPNSFSFTQQLQNLTPGKYQVSVQGFFRDGNGDNQAEVVNNNGELKQLAYLVANDEKAMLPNIASVLSMVPGIGDLRATDKGEFPNMPQSAIEYFETGFYKTAVEVIVGEDGLLNIGVKKDTKELDGDWVLFDNFRLTYLCDYATVLLEKAKADLADAIAAAEAIEADGYTAESFGDLTTAIADAKTALNAAEATVDSLNNAKTNLEAAVAGLKEISTIAEGVYDLTADMFHVWDGITAKSNIVEEQPNFDMTTGSEVGAGTLVYGNPSVFYLQYADLTGYDSLVFVGTPGVQLRVLMNRLEVGNGGGDANGGALTEVNPVIGENGLASVNFAGYELVHLNSIKLGWGSPTGTINKIRLVKGDYIVAAKADLAEAIIAAKAADTTGKTAKTVKVLTDAIAAAEAALVAENATVASLADATIALNAAVIALADIQPVQPIEGISYSWESPEGDAMEWGGTIAYVNGDGDRLNYKNGDYYTICLNGKKANINDETASANAGKMVITLDNAVAEGDTIAYTAYINKNESKKASPYIVFENGITAEGEVFSDEANIDAAFNGVPTLKYTVVPAEAAGSKTITLTRSQTGTNLFITKLQIIEKKSEPVPTGISTVKNNNLNGTIFNMNGQKVNKAQKGLYIINGKKTVVK